MFRGSATAARLDRIVGAVKPPISWRAARSGVGTGFSTPSVAPEEEVGENPPKLVEMCTDMARTRMNGWDEAKSGRPDAHARKLSSLGLRGAIHERRALRAVKPGQ